MDEAIKKETELTELFDSLNSFTFLKVTRAISAEDFATKIDNRAISNNVILICAQDLKTEINAKIKGTKKREQKIKGDIIFYDSNAKVQKFKNIDRSLTVKI